jgi:hypothetical protein
MLAPGGGPSGTFSGSGAAAAAITNNIGVATAPAFQANNIAGSIQVTAAVAGVSNPAIFSLSTFTACDLNQDGSVTVIDIQRMINESLGSAPPKDDLNRDKTVSVVDVQIVVNAVLSLTCRAL